MISASPNAGVVPGSSPAGAAPNNAGAVAAVVGQTPPPASGTPFASASLYIGDLTPDVTESMLFEIFNAVGPVASVRVCRDAHTRRSLGYAYVNFHRVEDAERALDTMNFSPIRSRPCRIMWCHRDPSLRKSGQGNIFVKNLHRDIDNKMLYDTFSIFGNILSCKVATNAKRESLGYGFVHYESDEAAKLAIKRVDGMIIHSQKVSVAPFKSKRERGGSDKATYTNIYIKNLPEDVDKKALDEYFGQFGPITSSVVSVHPDGKSRGFGFVNFEKTEDASRAVEETNNTEWHGKKLYVGRAQKKDEREKELRERFEQFKMERQKKYQGVNLYVKNLSDEVDDDRLRQEFSKFGSITSACVMRDASGKSRGFGFVCFATPEEATKALQEMNGKMLDSKPLYVALAQRREVRRAHLEAQHATRSKMSNQGPAMYAQGAPMFYAQPPRMMNYPGPQMVRQRWPQQGRPAPPMHMGAPMNFMGMPGAPVNGGGAGGPNAAGMVPGGNPRGGGPPRGRGQRNQQQGGRLRGNMQGNGQGRGRGANFKYTNQARNPRDQVPGGAPGGMAPGVMSPAGGIPSHAVPANLAAAAAAASAQPPLNPQTLAAADAESQKRMIGNRLFPLIHQEQPELAGKITGMLLEMDNGELLHLLESPEARREKISEAMMVLQHHREEPVDENAVGDRTE